MDDLLLMLPLCTGWLLDRLLGDPSWLPHPVVGFGRFIAWGEDRFNRGRHRRRNGAVLAVAAVVGTCGLAFLLLRTAGAVGGRTAVAAVSAICIFFCLAGTTLVREVEAVFRAADRSLEEGRRQVARIVGRDTSCLSDGEVRKAALETLAENLSDGVVAPLFWYLLLGVEGMMAYKMVNTLDSMIGYRTRRYRQFGWFAARIDDVANYLPARLTALLMIAVSGCGRAFVFVRRYGRAHLSPNSGYPEAALAGILGCRFGGPHDYFGRTVWKPFIGEDERPLTLRDMRRAVSVNRRTEFLMVVGVMLLRYLIG